MQRDMWFGFEIKMRGVEEVMFYAVYGRNGYGVMDSWEKVGDVEKYLGGKNCKKFLLFSEAQEWARESFRNNICVNGEHPRHGKLYFSNEYGVNKVVFAKNLRLKKAVILHVVD